MLVAPVARIQRIHVRKVIGTRAINGLFHMPWLNLLPSRRFASRRSRTGFSWCRFWGGFGVAVVWLCTPESMPSICLVYGLGVALGGFARPLAEATKREGWLGHCVFSQTPGSGLEHGTVETARGT